MLAVFIVSIINGFFLGHNNEWIQALISQNFPGLSLLNNSTELLLFIFIFLNNSIKTLMVILLGFALGLFPIYFAYINGLLLGAVYVYGSSQIGTLATLAGLLPHGIIELPVMIVASTYGFWLGIKFARRIFLHESVRPAFKQVMKNYAIIILPLLLIAALIETYITPRLIDLALR